MHGVHGVGSSNLLAPTIRFKELQRKLYGNPVLYIIRLYNIGAGFFRWAGVFTEELGKKNPVL